MRKKFFLPIVYIVLSLIFSGCHKETIEQEKDPQIVQGEGVKINKEQKVIDLTSTDASELESNDTIEYNDLKFPIYEVKIKGTAEEIEKIEPGTIINIPSGNKGGRLLFVYEVENAEKNGIQLKGAGALIIKGFQTTLDMYFNYENAILEFSTPDNRSKINSEIPNKLTGSALPLRNKEISFESKLVGLKFTSSPDKLCKISLSAKLWESEGSYVSAEGSLSVHPAIDLFMRYEPEKSGPELLEWLEAAAVPDALLLSYKDKNYLLGNMKQFRANVYTDVDNELAFKIHLSKKIKKTRHRVPLGKLTIPTVPVSAQMELAFEIDFNAIGALDLEIYKKEKNDIVLGVDMDRDLPEPTWYYEFDQKSESGLKLMAKMELETGISLVLETEVYVLGVLGPEVSTGGFLEATASVGVVAGTNDPLAANWKLSADAGTKGEVTLNLSAFHVDKATWEMWKMVEATYKENVYLAPDHLQAEQGNNQTGIMGQALPIPITIGAYDSRDKLISYLPVPLYFETDNGSTDPSGMLLTNDGKASTTWTLDNENENQKLNVYFKEGESKKGQITICASAQKEEQGNETGTFTDSRDGNTYKWVKIGDQVWMAENLAYLPGVSPPSAESYTEPYYYVYDYSGTSVTEAKATDNYSTYGVLYNWPAAMEACPSGWHLPTDEEWKQLEMALGMTQAQADVTGWHGTDQGKQMKATSGWYNSINGNGTNTSGFSALPGGYRYRDGSFSSIGYDGSWWSATEYSSSNAWHRYLTYNLSDILRYYHFNKGSGFSVRCVRD